MLKGQIVLESHVPVIGEYSTIKGVLVLVTKDNVDKKFKRAIVKCKGKIYPILSVQFEEYSSRIGEFVNFTEILDNNIIHAAIYN